MSEHRGKVESRGGGSTGGEGEVEKGGGGEPRLGRGVVRLPRRDDLLGRESGERLGAGEGEGWPTDSLAPHCRAKGESSEDGEDSRGLGRDPQTTTTVKP